jgi:hypothetical protein
MKLEYASLQEDARTQRDQNFRLNVLGREQDFTAGQNVADRAFRGAEGDKDRTSRAVEGGLERESRRGLQTERIAADVGMNTENNRTKLRAQEISAAATRYAATAGERRSEARSEQQSFRDARREFIKSLPDAFNAPKDQFQKQDPKALETYNRRTADATNIWDATSQKAGVYLTAQQIDQVLRGMNSGDYTEVSKKPGFRHVRVGSVNAVVPVSE